jgi:hypothetical protein
MVRRGLGLVGVERRENRAVCRSSLTLTDNDVDGCRFMGHTGAVVNRGNDVFRMLECLMFCRTKIKRRSYGAGSAPCAWRLASASAGLASPPATPRGSTRVWQGQLEST